MLLHSLLRQFDPAALPHRHSRTSKSAASAKTRGCVQPGRPVRRPRRARRPTARSSSPTPTRRGAVAVVTPRSAIDGCPLPQVVVERRRPRPLGPGEPVSRPARAARCRCSASPAPTARRRRPTSSATCSARSNQRCGMVGTVEIDDGRTRREAEMTTPGACDVAELLATMRDKRLPGVRDRSVAATRSTRAASPACRSPGRRSPTSPATTSTITRRWTTTPPPRRGSSSRSTPTAVAVVNADDKWADADDPGLPRRGSSASASARRPTTAPRTSRSPPAAADFVLHTPDGQAEVSMQLIGRHNIENALAAAALVGRSVRADGSPDRRGPARRARRAGAACSRCGPGSRSRCSSITPTPTMRWRTSCPRCGR